MIIVLMKGFFCSFITMGEMKQKANECGRKAGTDGKL
jgi:hypothetical protein